MLILTFGYCHTQKQTNKQTTIDNIKHTKKEQKNDNMNVLHAKKKDRERPNLTNEKQNKTTK